MATAKDDGSLPTDLVAVAGAAAARRESSGAGSTGSQLPHRRAVLFARLRLGSGAGKAPQAVATVLDSLLGVRVGARHAQPAQAECSVEPSVARGRRRRPLVVAITPAAGTRQTPPSSGDGLLVGTSLPSWPAAARTLPQGLSFAVRGAWPASQRPTALQPRPTAGVAVRHASSSPSADSTQKANLIGGLTEHEKTALRKKLE
jgi:hypothetical protein